MIIASLSHAGMKWREHFGFSMNWIERLFKGDVEAVRKLSVSHEMKIPDKVVHPAVAAVVKGRLEVVELLMELGIDCYCTYNHRDLLQYAAMAGHLHIVQYLGEEERLGSYKIENGRRLLHYSHTLMMLSS